MKPASYVWQGHLLIANNFICTVQFVDMNSIKIFYCLIKETPYVKSCILLKRVMMQNFMNADNPETEI